MVRWSLGAFLTTVGAMSLLSNVVGFILTGSFQTLGLELAIGCVVIGPYLLFKSDRKPVSTPQRNWAPPAVPPAAPVAPPPPTPRYEPHESVLRVIVEESNEPQDVRIRKLNNLRYERLITDEEFQAAKARILGI